jgi:CBS domain-containing protein
MNFVRILMGVFVFWVLGKFSKMGGDNQRRSLISFGAISAKAQCTGNPTVSTACVSVSTRTINKGAIVFHEQLVATSLSVKSPEIYADAIYRGGIRKKSHNSTPPKTRQPTTENNKKYINNNAFTHTQQEKNRMASNIPVRDIMSKDVKVVRNDTTVQEVVATMVKFDKDAILVVQSGKPTGIITVRDVLVRAVEHGMPLNSIIARMIYTNPLVTIDESATVEEAAQLMKQWKIKHLPVIKDERLVGMVTDIDIVFAVPKMMSTMEEVCRPQK